MTASWPPPMIPSWPKPMIPPWPPKALASLARLCRIACHGPESPKSGLDEAYAAYLDGFRAGDADAFMSIPADWPRHPLAALGDGCDGDRAMGYADGHAQETARQEATP